MIRDYGEMHKILQQALTGITDLQGTPTFLGYAVPEASVIDDQRAPAVVVTMIDERYDDVRAAHYGYGFGETEVTDAATGEVELRYYREYLADPVILVYQVDLYSHYTAEMIHLQRQLFARLKRRRGILLDPDGYTITYELTNTRDITRDVGPQRLFRRSLTYEFHVWIKEDLSAEDIETIGRVEHILHELRDTDEQHPGLAYDFWVDEPPPEQP